MGAVTTIQGARTALTVTGFGTLASATYVASSIYTANTNKPQDVVIEVEAATTNTAAGNQQVIAYVQASLDGTNFQTGPTSGTSDTDARDLTRLGVVPMRTNSATHRKMFNLLQALGFVPHSFKIVLKNDLGVALTSGAVYTAEISNSVA